MWRQWTAIGLLLLAIGLALAGCNGGPIQDPQPETPTLPGRVPWPVEPEGPT